MRPTPAGVQASSLSAVGDVRQHGRVRDLERDWAAALVAAGATADADTVAAAGTDLLARWRDPQRGYHDTEHLAEVLDAVDDLADVAADAAAVRLAAFFHDAVYDGRPGEDERRSAELAVTVLGALGVPAERVARVRRLVLLTAGHAPEPGDDDGAVLCDADLAILASGPERYARYVAGVRAEYAHVPDDVFRRGRAEVLRALVAAPRLYRTERARERWEGAARANVAREVRSLGS